MLLAFLGGALGLGVAAAGLRLFKAILPAGTPRLAEVHMDWRVLLFSGALALLTGFLLNCTRASDLALRDYAIGELVGTRQLDDSFAAPAQFARCG